MDVGTLREAIADATERGAAFGSNLDPSKPVMVRLPDGRYMRLDRVSVGFVNGHFSLILSAEEADRV